MTQHLMATKSFRYRTRRLVPGGGFEAVNRVKPGDIFEASDKDARLLLAIKKAKSSRPSADVAAPPATIAAKIRRAIVPPAPPAAQAPAQASPPLPQTQPSEPAGATQPAPPVETALEALREEYRTVFGKPPFNRWTASELAKRIDEAKAAKQS